MAHAKNGRRKIMYLCTKISKHKIYQNGYAMLGWLDVWNQDNLIHWTYFHHIKYHSMYDMSIGAFMELDCVLLKPCFNVAEQTCARDNETICLEGWCAWIFTLDSNIQQTEYVILIIDLHRMLFGKLCVESLSVPATYLCKEKYTEECGKSALKRLRAGTLPAGEKRFVLFGKTAYLSVSQVKRQSLYFSTQS